MRITQAITMKQAVNALSLTAILALGAPAPAQDGRLAVTVNEQPVTFTGQGPVESGGRVLGPLRGGLEKMGAYVSFDSARREVHAVRSQSEITLPLGSRTASVNGRSVLLDTPARVLNGSTMVPLRFVAEALGARVSFEPATRTVAIRTGQGTVGSQAALPPRSWNGARMARPGRTAAAGRVLRGTVEAVMPRQERIVIREADGTRDNVPLIAGFRVRRRTANGFEAMNLGDLRRGDVVALEMRGTEARMITVLPDRSAGGF